MQRRSLLQGLAALLAVPLVPACARESASRAATSAGGSAAGKAITPLRKPHAAWKGVLSAPAYAVLFEEDTERAGSSPLNNERRAGTFVCAACHLTLFESADKFDSGTGWPSFTRPIAGHTATKRDLKLIWPRTEYHCARCGGHQGHVFDDGPPPRGERWCNNGLALRFVARGTPLPALRS